MKAIPTKTSLVLFDAILDNANVKPGHRTADLGCGSTLVFLYPLLQKIGKQGSAYAIDILESALGAIEKEIKHHNLSGIIPLRANLEKKKGAPLPDKSLDRAFLINTLHQSSNSLAMLKEAHRLLDKKGILILVEWEESDLPLGPHKNRRISKKSATEASELIGFNVIKDFKAGPYHYGLVLLKS